MNMLTQDDLQAIGQLIEEKSTKPLQKQVGDLKVDMDKRFEAVHLKIDGLQTEMDTKFDAVQEQLDGIENRMITDESLERWETGLTERHDKRYVRQRS